MGNPAGLMLAYLYAGVHPKSGLELDLEQISDVGACPVPEYLTSEANSIEDSEPLFKLQGF